MRKILLTLCLCLATILTNAAPIATSAMYTITSRWNEGQYINIAYPEGGRWTAIVTYTAPMTVDSISSGSATITNQTITFTPTGDGLLTIGAQLRGDGDADPKQSYVLIDGQRISFADMPEPPKRKLDTYFIQTQDYLPTGIIKIGQTELPNVWESGRFSVQIPNERKQWAMALAHAGQLFKNVTGIDDVYAGANHYLATAIQESRIGADAASATFTYRFPANYPITYQPHAETDGFQQIEGKEGGSAYKDLQTVYPNRFGKLKHEEIISGPRFATSAIAAAYYNINMYEFLVGSDWKPAQFFKNAKDPQALDRVMALVYNRGAYSDYVSDVFTTKRTICEALPNMADDAGTCLPNNDDYGSRYVRQVPGFNKALIDAAQGSHAFPGYYNTNLTWDDINGYLNSIAILYKPEDIVNARQAAQIEFNRLANNGVIDFVSQFGKVLDKIMLALPVDSPSNNLCKIFGKCGREESVLR